MLAHPCMATFSHSYIIDENNHQEWTPWQKHLRENVNRCFYLKYRLKSFSRNVKSIWCGRQWWTNKQVSSECVSFYVWASWRRHNQSNNLTMTSWPGSTKEHFIGQWKNLHASMKTTFLYEKKLCLLKRKPLWSFV